MSYSIIWNASLVIYILDRCLFVIIWKSHWVQTPLKRYINGKTFAKCIHSNAQLHFYIPHTKESCIKVSKMSLRQISWKKSLERLTGWWLIFHIFISQWMLLQAESCVCVLINIFMCYERSSFQISSLYHLVLRFSTNNVNLCRFMMNPYFYKIKYFCWGYT